MNAPLKITDRDVAFAVADAPNAVDERTGIYMRFGKRAFDLTCVLLTIPISVPLLALCALAIALTGQAPFFRHKRIGRGGREFYLLKLRTMCANADAKLYFHLQERPDLAREWRVRQKLKRDPRVTRLGRFLRKTSLDELPQIWNVLRGDMSLIGPRPMTLDQTVLYPGMDYYAMLPGLSGPWQVTARNSVSFADRAHFDSEYRRDQSLKTDLGLVLRTFQVVIRGTGC